jgi:ubiquinone biosynthesis protein
VLFASLAVVASLVAMVVLVIVEVLVPDGSLPGPVELWRSWRARVARSRRYLQILRIAVYRTMPRRFCGQQPGLC